MPLTDAEKRLAIDIGFDEAIYRLLKEQTGRSWSRLQGFSAQYELYDAKGLSLSVDREELEPFFARLQPELLSRGYRAFWSNRCTPQGRTQSDEIAVLQGDDDFEIIRLRRSNGGNYGVSTDDILQKLREWRERSNFEVSGASTDWVFIQFATLPENVCTFAEEVFEFCPDTVEQGVGLKSEKKDPETFEAAWRLCPSISERTLRKLEEAKAKAQERLKARPLPPGAAEFLKQLESGAFGVNTTPEMGIRLLALDLKQTSRLFLWWD